MIIVAVLCMLLPVSCDSQAGVEIALETGPYGRTRFQANFALQATIFEIYYPSAVLETELEGNITLGAGSNGSVHLSSGDGGTVMYNNLDLHAFIKMLQSLPPIWDSPSAVGFSGKYFGDEFVNITLNAKDPEGGRLLYSVVAGNLPPGIILEPREGIIRGFAPAVNALYTVTIRASDPHHKYADAVLLFETVDTDRCALLKPCENGGICLYMSGSYRCECVGVFGGHNCEKVCSEVSFGVDANLKFIPDAQMSAYRSWNQSLASDGRLYGKGWCGQSLSWLQIDLGEKKRVHRVVTEGTTRSYAIKHSTDGMVFQYYTGSVGSSTPVVVADRDYHLPVVLESRFIRLLPVTYDSGAYPCLKVNILGCDVYY